MANNLNKSNIVNGNIVQASDITQIIDALTGLSDYNIRITGSIAFTGSMTIKGVNGVTSTNAILSIGAGASSTASLLLSPGANVDDFSNISNQGALNMHADQGSFNFYNSYVQRSINSTVYCKSEDKFFPSASATLVDLLDAATPNLFYGSRNFGVGFYSPLTYKSKIYKIKALGNITANVSETIISQIYFNNNKAFQSTTTLTSPITNGVFEYEYTLTNSATNVKCMGLLKVIDGTSGQTLTYPLVLPTSSYATTALDAGDLKLIVSGSSTVTSMTCSLASIEMYN